MEEFSAQVLVDNVNSWMLPYAEKLVRQLLGKGYNVELIHEHSKLKQGKCLVLLSCEKILDAEKLGMHQYNLVVHASALPEGRGWSPLTWQILEGKNSIPLTLFEAAASVDSGDIYAQTHIVFEGHELVDELRKKIADGTVDLILEFFEKYPNVSGVLQNAGGSSYRKRRPEDAALNIDKTIREQFNLLRISDNDRYPAYFDFNGYRYTLRVDKTFNAPNPSTMGVN